MAQKRNVLLVETNREIQSAVDKILKGSPFKLAAYSDRWAAFRAMKRKRVFDIALIDSDMATIGVDRALYPAMLKELKKDLDVIVLSDQFPPQRNSDLLSCGFRQFLSKAELQSRLLHLLRDKAGLAPKSPRRKKTAGTTAKKTRRRRSAAQTAN